MVMFYAPWCPACQSLKPTWQSFARQWSEDLSISVGLVDINKNPGLSGQFLVFQLPTLFHVKDGIVRPYTGARTQDAFVNWINDKSWRHIDPVEWWKSPNSIQMKAVAYFFRFANFIKDVHEQLTEVHGMPSPVVYVIFAVLTIIIGLVLGMMLVIMCDCIYPPKPVQPVDMRQYSKVEIAKTPVKQTKKSKKDKSKEAAPTEPPPTEPPAIESPAPPETDKDEGEAEQIGSADPNGSVRKRKPRKE
ncbi:thioredoxin-related transmembrane protein 1-like [Watersipora subatra]|uniref:thioredoxin-related transmembrane protein 1-like n=1 Tax=Watersipora subatra TaxID=2589382 RepID=UPI00355C9920